MFAETGQETLGTTFIALVRGGRRAADAAISVPCWDCPLEDVDLKRRAHQSDPQRGALIYGGYRSDGHRDSQRIAGDVLFWD